MVLTVKRYLDAVIRSHTDVRLRFYITRCCDWCIKQHWRDTFSVINSRLLLSPGCRVMQSSLSTVAVYCVLCRNCLRLSHICMLRSLRRTFTVSSELSRGYRLQLPVPFTFSFAVDCCTTTCEHSQELTPGILELKSDWCIYGIRAIYGCLAIWEPHQWWQYHYLRAFSGVDTGDPGIKSDWCIYGIRAIYGCLAIWEPHQWWWTI